MSWQDVGLKKVQAWLLKEEAVSPREQAVLTKVAVPVDAWVAVADWAQTVGVDSPPAEADTTQ